MYSHATAMGKSGYTYKAILMIINPAINPRNAPNIDRNIDSNRNTSLILD